jgi:predicted metal-dependent HD superfamily phosphohydrolase
MTSLVDVIALRMRFNRMWSLLECRGNPADAFSDLERRYTEPHRSYHTLEHIEDCLLQLEAACLQTPTLKPEERAEIEAVLFWHDAVYDTSSHTNEEQSAELANMALRDADVGDARRGRILNGILGTKHSTAHQPRGLVVSLATDIDLSILGSEPHRYRRYREGIEQEYRFGNRISERDYLGGRIQFLAKMLAAQKSDPSFSIFRTPYFRDRFFDSAMRNMTREIEILDIRLNH